jgi:hypothetical protein
MPLLGAARNIAAALLPEMCCVYHCRIAYLCGYNDMETQDCV